MSLYARLVELRPIPHQTEYEVSHKEAEAFFQDGDAWSEASHRFSSVQRDASLGEKFISLSQYGAMLQPEMLSNELEARPVPNTLVARAFTLGFMQQLWPTQLAYKSNVSLINTINIMHTKYATQDFEKLKDPDDPSGTRERFKRFNSEYIYTMGEYGIVAAGSGAEKYIEKWSHEVYYADKRLAKAFRLGHGAMILCAKNYQLGINDMLINHAVKKVDLNEEARAIFDSNTSEEQ